MEQSLPSYWQHVHRTPWQTRLVLLYNLILGQIYQGILDWSPVGWEFLFYMLLGLKQVHSFIDPFIYGL